MLHISSVSELIGFVTQQCKHALISRSKLAGRLRFKDRFSCRHRNKFIRIVVGMSDDSKFDNTVSPSSFAE